MSPLIRCTPGTLQHRFGRGAIWALIGALIGQSFTLCAAMITGRVLGEKGFGEFGIIQSTIGMVGVFAGFGLNTTTVKYVAEFQHAETVRAGRIIGLGTAVAAAMGAVCSLLIMAFAPALAKAINAPHLIPEIRIAAWVIPFHAVMGVQTGALAGLEAFRTIAGVNLLTGIVSFPLTITGVLIWRLPGVVAALVAVAAVGCGIAHWALRRNCASAGIQPVLKGTWAEIRDLWTFSLPALIAGSFVAPVAWIANAMLVNSPNGYSAMGALTAANQWRSLLQFVPSIVGQVVIPMTSALHKSSNRSQVSTLIHLSIVVNAIWAMPALVGLLFFSTSIMAFYGPGFSEYGNVLRLTAATGALLAVLTPVGNVVVGCGRMWAGALMNGAWAVVLLCVASLLTHYGWGAEGLALAYFIAYLAHATWTFSYGRRLMDSRTSLAVPQARGRPERMIAPLAVAGSTAADKVSFGSGAPSFARSGLASLADLDMPECHSLFGYLESVQTEFLSHSPHSGDYAWPRDPLHNWSRVWEYPYVFHHLRRLQSDQMNQRRLKALDFGSGVTFFPFALAREGFHVVCVDNDPICVRDLCACVDRMASGSNVAVRLIDGENLPFPDASIDVIYSISVLEHLPDPAAIVSEFARVLSPCGRLLLTIDIELSPDMEVGIGPARYARLMDRLHENFEYAEPRMPLPHPAMGVTTRGGPYPLVRQRHGLRAVWWVVKQEFLKPLLGRKPHCEPFVGCEGLVLRKRVV